MILVINKNLWRWFSWLALDLKKVTQKHCDLILISLTSSNHILKLHKANIYKIDSQWEFAICLRELKSGFCDNLERWAKMGGGREAQEEGTDPWWSMAETNTMAIILQIKIRKKRTLWIRVFMKIDIMGWDWAKNKYPCSIC